MFTVIRGGDVYAPEHLGRRDILIANGVIARMEERIEFPDGPDVTVIDASGTKVVPGLIDGHHHLLGGGGAFGPDSRSSISYLSMLTKAGVTTCVGMLGIDKIAYSLEDLLVRSRALEYEGLSAFMLTGSYTLPSPTITGAVMRDLYLIDKVVGVKIAVFEALSSHPDKAMLRASIAETWLGGRLGGKAGITVAHVGNVPGDLLDLVALLDEMNIPQSAFMLTHINRSRERLLNAAECGKRGMLLDLTGNIPQQSMIPASRAYKILLEEGVPAAVITLGSDSNPAYAYEGVQGILPVDICLKEMQAMVREWGMTLTQALLPLTVNPAKAYRLEETKGSLDVGKDADIVCLGASLQVETVIARGKLLLADGKPVVRGRLEEPTVQNLT